MSVVTESALLHNEQIATAAQTLADAFFDDPMMTYLAPDQLRRKRLLPLYFTSVLRLSRAKGSIYVSEGQSRVQGAIVGMPPGTFPLPVLPQLTHVRTLLAARWQGALRNFRDVSAIDRARPPFPFWYVMFLGVAPTAQRSGVGSVLLRRVLSRADDQGVSTYLVTLKAENLAYYARFGFEVRDELRLGKAGPPTWTLLRPTQASGDNC